MKTRTGMKNQTDKFLQVAGSVAISYSMTIHGPYLDWVS